MHIDVPSILSGGSLVYLDPQKEIWPGDPGRYYDVNSLRGSDMLVPFSGIEGFDYHKTTNLSKTIFRFPLREKRSGLSDNTYTTEKLSELIDEMKKEAKFLLLFLRSVHTVEVYDIPQLEMGKCDLFFSVRVAHKSQSTLINHREAFMTKLRHQHSLHQFIISNIITDVVMFDVQITDTVCQQPKQTCTVSWLVASQVGTSNRHTLEAAEKQHVFPWVGVALELDTPHSHSTHDTSSHGRVFCFLPLPIETSSKLPVHVNGTFGLNDDRRTIKWPARERINDETAQWNQTLVTECLPSCYNLLLRTAIKGDLISPEHFYSAWPDLDSLKYSHWSLLLNPLFSTLLQWNCLWAQNCGKWVSINQAVVVPECEQVPVVVKRVLTKLKVLLCDVPTHVYEIIKSRVCKVSPSLVCNKISNHLHSYQMELYQDKLELLRYCLSDDNFSMLSLLAIELLPMANQTFRAFGTSVSYVCTQEFPRNLLPNLDHKLVDLKEGDKALHEKLEEIASSTSGPSTLKLKCLSASVVANLLPQCYPQEWKNKGVVKIAHRDKIFPYEWCELFWTWVQKHDLSLFVDQLVVPLVTDGAHNSMQLTRLSCKSAVVLIESETLSSILVENFAKLGVHCTISKHIPYLQHRQRLKFLNSCDPCGLLTAISNSGQAIQNVSFSSTEAVELQLFLASQKFSLNKFQVNVLQRLCIFHVLNHRYPISLLEASKKSWKKKLILSPDEFSLSSASLPSNLLILSSLHNQHLLIQACASLILTMDSFMSFLLTILFPMIESEICAEDKVEILMVQVLQYFTVLKRGKRGNEFKSTIANLKFIHVRDYSLGLKAPNELFDCSKHLLTDLFHGLPVFPCSPFNQEEMLLPLRECGLQTEVSGQVLLKIIGTYACTYSKTPQTATRARFLQAKAVLAYMKEYPDVLHQCISIKQKSSCFLYEALRLAHISKNWLPVIGCAPEDYPQCLKWMGESHSSQLVSHNSSVLLCSSDDLPCVSSLVGSQMHIVECSNIMVKTFGQAIPTDRVLQHLIQLVQNQSLITDLSYLNLLVHKIYSFLSNNLDELKLKCPTSSLRHQNLVWMKKVHKFDAPDHFVLNEHPTFQHNLAPFYQVLPESLSEYSELFVHFGAHRDLSNSDIVKILKKIKDHGNVIPKSLAWEMVTSILNWLTNQGQTPANEKLTDSDVLYVPVDSDVATDRPQLVKVEDVVYTDLDFLKYFEASKGKTFFIHASFLHIATLLGVKRLSAHWDISHDAFGDVGPHEPLVTRLKNILRDYKDGLTIIKELIQNADDAKASEVNICYDGRTHSVEPGELIFPGMAKCHGPALLVHNNSTFTDADLNNITKLAAETKKNDHSKIGQFGLGFCSVYHITDVPSFVSGEWLYIFDPAILYLDKEINDKAKPGKKLRFTERIVHFSKQLVPYKDLYGFKQGSSYQGTMFRFPFRTTPNENNISNIHYNMNHVTDLLADVKKAGSKLFLFLNHIKRITFSWIGVNDNKPTTIFSMEKTVESAPEACTIQKINIYDTKTQVTLNECWLTASSLTPRRKGMKKPGRASVVCLMQSSSKHIPEIINGEVFCFLPLFMQTGLPVHVNANFDVLSDRNGIHVSDSDSPSEEAKWNVELCTNVIHKAYFSILVALQILHGENHISLTENDYSFYTLWPLKHELKAHNPWERVLHSLYVQISSSTLFYSDYISRWLHLHQSHLLSDDILLTDKPNLASDIIDSVVKELELPIISLPSPYLEYFSKQIPRAKQIIHARTIHEEEFINLFFNNIHQISFRLRNEMLFFVLRLYAKKSKDSFLKQHLIKERCIPCTPDGYHLKKCSEIVDPCAYFVNLYDDSDGFFPVDKFHKDDWIHNVAMHRLGIIKDNLPWEMIVQRATTIPLLFSMDDSSKLKALQRSFLVLKCINDQLNISTGLHKPYLVQLTKIPFIPVLKQPKDYPLDLKWSGEDNNLLCSEKVLQGSKNIKLAGSQVCIVMEGDPEEGGCGPIPLNVATTLGIGQDPSYDVVVKHLLHIVSMYIPEEADEKLKAWVGSACEEIYQYFDKMLSERYIITDDLATVNDNRTIWTGTIFVSPCTIARSWSQHGPYLYGIPYTLASKKNLIEVLNIQPEFTMDHFLSALQQIHVEYEEKPVNDQVFKTIVEISNAIAMLSQEVTLSLSDDQECFLPDINKVMRKTSELSLNDAQWIEMSQESFRVHSIIRRTLALQLGVIDTRSKALQPYIRPVNDSQSLDEINGKSFGQHEDLKQRIKNILHDYPRDITVLKELVQNADDARASKMYIILDKRRHGTKKLPSPEWQDLQGPALLVWNDSGMSEMDLKGIQQLGLGSKRSSVDTIGQYGIGFNVVYHLTDCPSFLTNGNTLCVLDPHCRYVPGANKQRPGWRFDGIDTKFWSNFSDLKSTYLHDNDEEFSCLSGVKNEGTLFRFPLRHSKKLSSKSDLVNNKHLPAWQLERELHEWAPKIKEALLFLNHVTELKLFVIHEKESRLTLTHKYQVQLTESAKDVRDQFLQTVSSFISTSSYPCLHHYQVSLREEAPKQVHEEWLIQQGIGNVHKEKQDWQSHPDVIPRYGIAAQISGHRFVSKVFCFLPLPLESRLPVHINGKFVLDSSRSGLWQSRDPSKPDDRQNWNLKLIDAIASSYVQFLEGNQEQYVSSTPYQTDREIRGALQSYYHLFPMWRIKHKPEREMLKLAELVYTKLSERNSPVLALISKEDSESSKHSAYTIQWLRLTNKEEPSRQTYFWEKPDKEEHSDLRPVLKKMGVQLTDAPIFIQRHFTDVQTSLPLATSEDMFEYYSSYYSHVGDGWPCPITDTKFESVANFIKFVKYVIKEKHFEEKAGTYFEFPKLPVGIPLCLTAGEILQPFSNIDKLICSKFSHLFTTSHEKFVHPEVFKLSLVPEYFIESSEENWELISDILKECLPECLWKNTRIKNASKHINIRDVLMPLWHCFAEEVFRIHLTKIMNEWALLLSKGNELFLYESLDDLLPVIPPPKLVPIAALSSLSSSQNIDVKSTNCQLNEEVFQILQNSGMPILDIEVVSPKLCTNMCPKIDQPARMLQNLYNLYQSGGLTLLPHDKTFDRKIAKLFTYFSPINFFKDKDSLDRVKSLPFFKNIDNSYNSLTGETYVWPSHICLSGKHVWIDMIKDKAVVFLKTDGVWSRLGSAETLGIDVLSPWSFYTKFIFPYYHLLSTEERMKHLKHIRNTPELFNAAHYDSEAKFDSDHKKDALTFINALKKLQCIFKNGALMTVSSLCDPDVQLFKEFPDTYEFPPEELSDRKWLEFFRKIGLKTDINKQEFISLCDSLAYGHHKRPSKASRALLNYLFDKHDWHVDVTFLDKVSEIPFVYAEPLKNLSSIVPTAIQKSKELERHHQEEASFTSLNKAASKEIECLVWTVMPVVHLPRLFYTSNEIPPWKLQKKREEFYVNLHICKEPQCCQVVENLLNISNSRYADFKLFDKYDENSPHRRKEHLLFEVIVTCFNYLSKTHHSDEVLSPLLDAPCIPVSCNGEAGDVHYPVLVPARQVIANDLVRELVPFLNPLPEALYSALPTVLSSIGVTREVQYDNVRYALQIMHDRIKQPLDLNTTEKLKKLIWHLYLWLSKSEPFAPSQQVLYLPNDHRELVESTELVYNDKDNYKQAYLQYKFMSLLVDEYEEWNVYNFCLKDFHSFLPKCVRPLALSSHCIELVSKHCKQRDELTYFASKIQQALSQPKFAHVTVQIIKARARSPHLKMPTHVYDPYEEALACFHQSVTVHSIEDLEVDVQLNLNDKQPATAIGTANVDFLLESKMENIFSLYIDSDADALTLGLLDSLAANIVSVTVNQINSQVTPDFVQLAREAVRILLQSPPPEQLRKLLNNLGVNTAGLQLQARLTAEFTPKLGQPIPRELYHRLQCDIHNVFRTHEWVGYEDKENHIIFAHVEDRIENFYDTQEEIVDTEGEDISNGCEELNSYKIITSEDDVATGERVMTVTVLELYKFLRVKRAECDDGSTKVVPYNPDLENVGSMQLWDTVKDGSLASILQKIYEEIKWIESLELQDKKQTIKAIKLIYLKFKLDNTSHPLPMEAFQFLKRQLKRLYQKQHIENPEQAQTQSVSESDVPNPHLDKRFQEFENFICTSNESLEQESESINQTEPLKMYQIMDDNQVYPEPLKAEKWFEQSKCDLEALKVLFDSSSQNLNAHVCFMAHQVAEKALKAGMYKLIGLHNVDIKHHELAKFAEKIDRRVASNGHKLEDKAILLMNEPHVNHYLNTRYPNRWNRSEHSVPSKEFNRDQAIEARDAAIVIVDIIRCLFA